MRISFVLPESSFSGGMRAIAMHVRNLRARGHRVTVVSMTGGAPPLRKRVKSLLQGRGWPRAPGHVPGHLDAMGLEYTTLPGYRAVVDADLPEADAVVATWWTTAHWVSALSPSRGVKFHFVQDHETWGGPLDEVAAAYRLPLRKIVVSSWLADLVQREYGQTPVANVWNGVELSEFDTPPRGKQGEFTVGFTYTAVPHKGLDVAFRALALVRPHLPGLRLLSMSNGDVDPDLPLPEGTHFTARARGEALRALYASCDAWLYPSRWEGYGLPVLEAMACRTPVVGTPAGAGRELIGQGGGILVPVDDPEAMAAGLRRIAGLDDAAWRTLSDRARATAEGCTWDAATTVMERAIEDGVAADRAA